MIKPTKDRVLIMPDKPDEKTKSGILLGATKKSSPTTGEIVAVGSEVEFAQVGQRVFFDDYTFEGLKDNELEYKIGKEENILATME